MSLSHRIRSVSAALAATALAITLTACASAGSTASATCDTPASAAAVVDARGLTGVTTACLDDRAITPVADQTAAVLPTTVVDAEDRSVTVASIERILPIDISGTIAATVFGLGLGDHVVGRDSSTTFPGTENLPVVTQGGHTLNAEAILSLAPTVVLTDTTIGPKEVRQQLRDAGIAVVVISSERRLDGTAALTDEIARALGVPSRGSALAARLTADVAAAQAEVAATDAASARPRVLFLYVRGSANVYYIFGRDSGADSLIEAIGGIDVAGEIGWEGMRPMTAEALAAAQPDVLLMMTDGLASVGGIDGLLERVPALQQTPAGEHRRVVDMADGPILAFGPHSADVVRALAAALRTPGDDAPGAGASATPAS